ncbi:PIG-L deacetylase family protein [Rhodopirellula sallentina]|nr:PIG-L family deacetylase [Rhodopirellula sallentina]
MAHPDDAEMTCAGTLIRLSRSGWEIHIATVTAGDCGSQSLGPEETAAMRVEEGTRAAELAGATFHCLGEPDGRVVYDRQSLQKTIDLFRRITPSLVITMPMSDYHSDHEMTGRLGRAASFVYAAPNASDVPLGDGATVPRVYYCDGLGGRDRMGDLIEPTTFVDISGQLELKASMLACHQSQRDWLRSHNGIDNYIESMRTHSVERGRQCGVDAAEAFVQHRGHGHPADDLLLEMFGPGRRGN